MKIALITGANSGFGYLTAIELLNAGYTVIATMRDLSKSNQLKNKAAKSDGLNRLHLLKLDVTNASDIEQVFRYVKERMNRLDVLVNNAGYCEGGFLSDLTIEDWKLQQDTNVNGTVHMTKRFLPLLNHSGRSHIINLSSVSGMMGLPGLSAYCASKFAIEGLSESLRIELLPNRTFVSLVEPASYQTNIWKKALSKVANLDENSTDMKKNVYLLAKDSARNGKDPKEVAQLIVRICNHTHPKLRYRVGQGTTMLAFMKRVLPWRVIEFVVMKKLKKKR